QPFQFRLGDVTGPGHIDIGRANDQTHDKVEQGQDKGDDDGDHEAVAQNAFGKIGGVGALPIQVTFSGAAVAMVMTRIISLREAYESIDWSVVVLLGAMIP
ncbi:hypothetical protein DC030_15465, partial [Enterococcus faecalis]